MYTSIKNYCSALMDEFNSISQERKLILKQLAEYISKKQQHNEPCNLTYICTHNSRRSHFGQIWATVAINYHQLNNIKAFSGGTEVTAFNSNAIIALRKVGFKIEFNEISSNTIYNLFFDDAHTPIICYSKEYNTLNNPQQKFAAILTCTDADSNCPIVVGADLRISTPYDDPKNFDNTALQEIKYDERCKQIALEVFYTFSLIKN